MTKSFQEFCHGPGLQEHETIANLIHHRLDYNAFLMQIRSVKKKAQSFKYTNKVQQKDGYKKRTPKEPFRGDPTNDIFQTKPPEEAVSEEKQIFIRKKM